MTAKGKGTATVAPVDATREAFILAPTQAAGARVMGVSGKWLRDIGRSLHGKVSAGAVYDDVARAALYDAARARLTKRNAPRGDGS